MQYTLKQIADKAGVSKTTVRRHRDKLPESFLKEGSFIENKVYYYSEEVAERIIKSLENAGTQAEHTATQAERELDKLYRNIAGQGTEDAETCQEVSERSGTDDNGTAWNVPELYRNAGELIENTCKEAIAALSDQLKAKDEQIKELSEMLRAAQEQIKLLLDQQERQALTASEQEQEQKKQSLLSKLFGKGRK